MPARPVAEYDNVYPCGAVADIRSTAENVTPEKPEEDMHQVTETAFVFQADV